MLTGEQIRAARSMLRLNQRQLAEMAHVSVYAVRRMEATSGPLPYPVELQEVLKVALESAGVKLIGPGESSGDGGHGVRLEGELVAEDKIAEIAASGQDEQTGELITVPAAN